MRCVSVNQRWAGNQSAYDDYRDSEKYIINFDIVKQIY